MKYFSTKSKQIIEIMDVKNYSQCPECSKDRKKPNLKPLKYYHASNSFHCFHCETNLIEYKPFTKEKKHFIPEWKNETKLTDKAVNYLTGRMISQKTLIEMKVYSDTVFMPQLNKKVEVMCFPYFLENKLINIKFRGPEKSFMLTKGAEKILYNIDSIINATEAMICEGEIDCLSWITCGYKTVVSVPNGAGKNTDYLNDYISIFETIEKVYIATDNDVKGIELKEELIRRIGPEKCFVVTYQECKDSNEYLQKYGGLELLKLKDNAKKVQIKGIFEAIDFYDDLKSFFEVGVQRGKTIDVPEIDKNISWETKRLAIITGIPGMGKSEFVDYLITKLNIIHGWKAAIFSPENYPLKYHYAKIFEKIIGKQFSKNKTSEFEFDLAFEYIVNNFFYILDEEDMTIERIFNLAKILIKQKGIKILVIDPYNKIDHQITKGVSETAYISVFLDKLIQFGKFNDLLIFLVAHPTKMQKGDIPTLYNVSGSAHFFNKCDYGFTIHRPTNLETNKLESFVDIHWQKIKFKHLGEDGVSQMKYNYNNGRYETGSVDMWDNSNWLIKDNPTFNITSDFPVNLAFDNEMPF